MNKLMLAVVLSSSILGGCATNTLYQWGAYDDHLHAAYKDASKIEALRLKLEAHIREIEQAKSRVAPGLYAEVGTLHLQAGRRSQAVDWYKRERQAWPESQQLMSALIQNIERLDSTARTVESTSTSARKDAQ